MKRIEEYEKEIQSAASEHLNRHIGSGVMYLCGKSGMGNTFCPAVDNAPTVVLF